MRWLDFAWRLPVAVFVRAPVMILAYGLGALGEWLEGIGAYIPGLPYRLPWKK